MDSSDDDSFVTALSQPCSQSGSCGIATQIDGHLAQAEKSLVQALASMKKGDTALKDKKPLEHITAAANSSINSESITTQVEFRVFTFSARQRVDEALRAIEGAQAHMNQEKTLRAIKEAESSLVKASRSAPGARLIIAYPPGSSQILSGDSVIPLKTLSDRDFYGVFHKKDHVDFKFSLPFPKDSEDLQSQLEINFQPSSDECLFTLMAANPDPNSKPTTDKIHITDQSSNSVMNHLSTFKVKPGHWSISEERDNEDRLAIDILVLGRQFGISLHKLKREATDSADNHGSVKRLKAAATSQDLEATTKSKIGQAIDPTDIFRRHPDVVYTEFPHAAQQTLGQTINLPRNSLQTMQGVNPLPTQIWELQDGDVAFINTQTGREDSYTLRLMKQLSRNSNSQVFHCQHSKIYKTPIVAKVFLTKGDLSCIKAAKLWKQEKNILQKITHPNIVSLVAFDSHIYTLYLELLPPALSHPDQELQPPYSLTDMQKILQGISSALAYLETQDIIHFDIKPANIAYSSSFSRGAILLDFNLAHFSNDRMAEGRQDFGTAWYVPPELLQKVQRSFAGDIWALGITILYTMDKLVYPESTGPWRIDYARRGQGNHRQRMTKWLDRVATQKQAIRTNNTLHALVVRMLHPDVEKRVKAAELQEQAAKLQERADESQEIAVACVTTQPKGHD